MDRQTLRWLAFSLGVDVADADQDQRNQQRVSFVFSALVVLFLGCLFISCRRVWFLILLFPSVLFLCLRGGSERICV
jgi:hypothetical protein